LLVKAFKLFVLGLDAEDAEEADDDEESLDSHSFERVETVLLLIDELLILVDNRSVVSMMTGLSCRGIGIDMDIGIVMGRGTAMGTAIDTGQVEGLVIAPVIDTGITDDERIPGDGP